MKRFVLLFLLAILSSPFVAIAQSGDKVTGAMVVTTTETIVKGSVVTPKEEPVKEKKKLKAVEIKRGYQQEVSFAWSCLPCCEWRNHINFNYVGGFRFNHYFFAGIGTGLDFGAGYNFKPLTFDDGYMVLDSQGFKTGDQFYTYYGNSFGELPIQKVSIPLYVHLRAYFMKTKWAPFLAFSAGMRISASKKLDIYHLNEEYYYGYRYTIGDYIRTEKYGAVTGMFEVMPGVNYQYSNKLGFNFQFGYATRTTHYMGGDGSIRSDWCHGFTMRLGVVF